jgi:hypothetical protein
MHCVPAIAFDVIRWPISDVHCQKTGMPYHSGIARHHTIKACNRRMPNFYPAGNGAMQQGLLSFE